MSESTMRGGGAPAGLVNRFASLLLEKIGAALVGAPDSGSIVVTLPSGRQRILGNPHAGIAADLQLRNFKVLGEAMRRGTVGFASAFIDGDVDSSDLTNLFRFFIQNQAALNRVLPGFFKRAAQDLAYHIGRANTREGSRENISEHYDLGNDFYGEWLDPTMTYSSAVFVDDRVSLEDAQREKYRRVIDALDLRADARVLEIGCGWGGFAETLLLGHPDASMRGITLSREQLDFARDRLARQNLDDRGELVFEDYRDTAGQFDHVASIEMIEAVGEEHWPGYFKTVHDRLRPGGTAAIQAISIREEHFAAYKAGPDFIQRFIFPGGMLMTKTAMVEEGERAGLQPTGHDCFGLSYARTLKLWRERFLARWPHIAALGYSEAFKRKWQYYLAYCEAGFTEGMIDVGIYRYRRPA